MLMSCVPIVAKAEIVDSGQCGDNVYWKLDSNGTLTINGEGEMHNTSLWADRMDIVNVIINNGITTIGEQAFLRCYRLRNVTMPESIICIEYAAFSECTVLQNITIPQSTEEIDTMAFYKCKSLKEIEINKNIKIIGGNAFAGCGELEITVSDNNENYSSINGVLFNKHQDELICYSKDKVLDSYNIPLSVKTIGGGAFEFCDNLKSIKMSSNVVNIDSYAFYECSSLNNITLSSDLKKIGLRAFSGCKALKNIDIPPQIDHIDIEAFSSCSNLTSITLPDLIKYIGDGAFSGCSSMKQIVLPNSITSIGQGAFSECSSLETIHIPINVKNIRNYTFRGCRNLMQIELYNNIENIYSGAFDWCNNITDIYYNGTQNQWNNIKGSGKKDLENVKIHYLIETILNYTSSQRPHLWLNANGITSTYLGIGQTYQSGIQAYPLTAYPTSGVTWHSTNPQVATVSQSGLITGVTEGNANIYITTADGITSDAMNVVVTDLSKFSKSVTYTDKVNQIGSGSNYEWIIKNNNFSYWHSFVGNDNNAARYYFQNYLGAPLFDMSEIKNLYSGECSVERAKEILLAFVADSYDDTFKTVKKDFSYKLGKKAVGTLSQFLDEAIDKGYGARLDALGEKNIITAFESGGYEGGIETISNYLEPNNPNQVGDLMRQWLATDTVSECFSALSKVIDLRNNVSKIGNEIMDVQVAAQTGEAYCNMLSYLEQNCISSNVRRAAAKIKFEMSNSIKRNITCLSCTLAANKAQDKIINYAFGNVFKLISGSKFVIKIGVDLGVFVSNEILHVSDALKCMDNVRLLSYMSVAMVSNINDIHMRFLNESDIVKKEDLARSLVEQYNILTLARKSGEENYYKVYKYTDFAPIKEFFGWDYAEYDQWYEDTVNWLNAAKSNPEKKKGRSFEYAFSSASLYSVDNKPSAIDVNGIPYTAEEFYALFADKGFADAVLYSLGTGSENPDWNIVTHEAVEQLDILTSENQNSISNISGISVLKNLQYLDLSNQHVQNISDEILQLGNLRSINLFNNGLTEYPTILNDIPSVQNIVLSYNLLTESPEIIDTIEVDLTGNLLNPNEYLSQRYLYCEMPIIYDSNADLYDMVKLKDIYGCEFEYNGDSLFVDGIPVSEYDFLNTDAETVTISVNYSDNPNAQLGIAVDISETAEYTEETFAGAFPDENLRNAVLSALNIDKENIDYSKITPVTLAEINVIEVDGAVDLKGIELLKGLNKLNATNSKFETIPRYLSVLSNLQTLSLRGSDISSLSGITSLKALDNLDISECNNITDISDIKNISNLETLYADGLGMSNILDIVQEMPTVKTLSVSGNCIENIDCILGRSFNYLNIQGNYIDEEVLKNEYLPQLMSVCNTLSYSPQINSLVSDVAVSGNTATITIKNDTGAIFENVTLITAHYRNNMFVGCDTQNVPLIKVDEALDVNMTLNDVQQDDEIKCFVWNGLDGMVSVSREYTWDK